MAKHQREPIAWEQLRPVKLEKFITSYPDDHSLAYNPEVLLMGMKYGAGAFRAGHSTNMVQ